MSAEESGSAPGAEVQERSSAPGIAPPFLPSLFLSLAARSHLGTSSSLPPGWLALPDARGSFRTPDRSVPLLLCYPSKISSSRLRGRRPDSLGSLCPPHPQCRLLADSSCFAPPNSSLPQNLLTSEPWPLAPEAGALSSSSKLCTLPRTSSSLNVLASLL